MTMPFEGLGPLDDSTKEHSTRFFNPGDQLGRYTILRCLGRGGMGVVYAARDPSLERDIAIKTLPADMSRDQPTLDRFKREALILASLTDPGLVTIYSVESEQGIPFLTMELVRGKNLGQLIVPDGLPLDQVFHLGKSIASALSAAHRSGVIHRDIKPSNVMVLDDGRIKLCDFGISKRCSASDRSVDFNANSVAITEAGQLIGTPAYLAPEVVQGHPATSLSDIYALGVVLWEMVTGQRPFTGRTPAVILSAILRDAPAGLDGRQDLPSELIAILHTCLHKDPQRRPASADELRRRLDSAWISRQVGAESATATFPELTVERPIERIAVLPLVESPTTADPDFIADGITENLITDLAKLALLKVISKSSVTRYRGTDKSIQQIGQELNVDAVVEGSVRRIGDRIRVSAQLIRVTNSELIWAERYDRKFEDVLSLQDELARSIVRGVGGKLVDSARRSNPAPHKIDPEVFTLVSRGRQLWNRRIETAYREAAGIFQQAIDRDPSYSPAWLGLAETLGLMSNHGYIAPDEAATRIRAATDVALELNPHSGDAHRLRAFAYWQFDFAWQAACDEYDLALQLDPASWLTTYWYGAYLGVIGQFERSHRLLSRAGELDPMSLLIPSVQGWVLFFERRFDEAIEKLRPLVAIDHNYMLSHWFLGEAQIEAGDFQQGIAMLERAATLAERASRILGYLGYAYARAGRHNDARLLLQELESRASIRYVPPYFLALIHAGLEQGDQAIKILQIAWEKKDTMIRDLRADPHWDRLRSHPGFRQIFTRMNFPNHER